MFGAGAGLPIAVAALATCVCTALVARLAERWGWVDRPDGRRKRQPRPVPLLGGVALWCGVGGALAGCGRLGLLGGLVESNWAGAFLVSALAACALGLWDDFANLRPQLKLGLQFLAAFPFAVTCAPLTAAPATGGWMLDLGALVVLLVWLVACMNVVNLIDGLDGLAASIALTACLGLAALAAHAGRLDVCLLALIVAGGLAGYLPFSLPAARIYLGDSGSLFLGFVIGGLGWLAALDVGGDFRPLGPIACLAVPLWDTCVAILRRGLAGRSPFEADRAHWHHCLLAQGCTSWGVLRRILPWAVGMSVLGVVTAGTDYAGLVPAGFALLIVVPLVARQFGHREWSELVARYSTLNAGDLPASPDTITVAKKT